jgi:hypothetical protein
LKKPNCLIKNFLPPLFAISKGMRKEVLDGLVTAPSGTIAGFLFKKEEQGLNEMCAVAAARQS